jgi:hypothetical protein
MSIHSTGRDLHVDVPLSNVIVGRRPAGFIADQFIPQTPVDKQSNMYWKFNVGENIRYEAGLTYRAPGTEPKKVHMSVASDNYYTPNYALGTDWTVEDEVNADQMLNWATANATMLMDRLMIDYEYRIANLAVNTSNVRTVTVAGCGWTTNAPIVTQMFDYVEKFRQATGMLPNTLVIPQNLLQYIAVNSQARGILFGNNNGGIVTPQNLAGLFNIERVLIPQSQVNTAGDVETKNGSWSYADIWGNQSIWMSHTKTLAGMYTDTWINAFRWSNPALGQQFSVERFPYDPKKKSYDIAVGYYQAEKVVSPDLAMRIIVNSY